MEMNGGAQVMRRRYFVAFAYWGADCRVQGVGSTIVERELPVSNWDDILSMTECILSCNPDKESIVILNWRKFEDPE
jgi:hypothetical protein